MPEENVHEMWSDQHLDAALASLRSDVDADARELARTRTGLLAAAGAQPRTPAAAPPARRHWPRWAQVAAAVAAVAALVTGVLVARPDGRPAEHGSAGHGGDQPEIADAAASVQLNAAADRIHAADEPLAPGQFRYIALHAWWASFVDEPPGYTWVAENLLETWVPAQEKQQWMWRRDVTGKRKWLVGTEAQARAHGIEVEGGWPEGVWRAPCGDWFAKEEGRTPCTTRGSWSSPNEEFMASLPRDPDKLYAALRAVTADSRKSTPDMRALQIAADFLGSGLVPADLRAAMYRVLAKLPTVRVTEKFANLDGRKGTAFGVTDQRERLDVIIDPASGRFIGKRSVVTVADHGLKPGSVLEYTALDTAVVDGMGVRPAR
ncbi:MAG TPA: CU044_5270 family protein [Actinophytocola sp.]|jgi:hypothetical protein|uniref:CU044_5270 family protein n=1 Tax=Actinophytocola sp. TaxID=1872138 RepID=UPI002F93CD44